MLRHSLCLAATLVVASASLVGAESLRARPTVKAPERPTVQIAPQPRVERSIAAPGARPQADYPVPPVYDILAQSYPPPAPPRPGFAATPDLEVDAALLPLGPPASGGELDTMIVDNVRSF